MRTLLRVYLENNGAQGSWDHITSQIGMFSFIGLSEAQCEAMVKQHHIHMAKNGRISVSGLTNANIPYIASCIKDVK